MRKINDEKKNKNKSIKEIYWEEKIRLKNPEKHKKIMKEREVHKILTCKTSEKYMKYVNRDINAVKNMRKIVISYIEKNTKPVPFIMGTKICNIGNNI